jgi:hypothetical protein
VTDTRSYADLRLADMADNPQQVIGNLLAVAVELTRPANTDAYAAGDVVSNNVTTTAMLEFANAAREAGGSGYITGIRVATDKKSITPRLRVHIFRTNGATLSGDNAQWRGVYTDDSKLIGSVDLAAMTTGADTTNSTQSIAQDFTVRLPYTCVATSLYVVLETIDAFTPTSGQKFSVTLYLDRN